MAETDDKYQATLRDCVGDEVAATDPITTRDGLANLARNKFFGMMGVRLKSKDPAKIVEITEDDWSRLKTFFWGVGHIQTFSAKFNTTDFSVQGILKLVANPQIRFPERFQHLASLEIERFEKQNWGVTVKAKKEPPANPANTMKRGGDVQNADDTTAKKTKRISLDKTQLRRPPPGHEIYGENGIMRGVLRYKNKAGVPTYALDDKFKCGDAKVFGHNGFPVGTWFPQLLAALRDGCHGERTSGIAGDPTLGAWSIVVNRGEYKDVDKDLGDRVIFSSPGSFDSKSDALDKEKRGTNCLLASLHFKRPIRVIRGQTNWKRSPVVGYRYDGLFTVEEKGEGKNADGGSYIWFRLERMKDQDPIPKHSPNRVEMRQHEKIAEGY